jgi:hypothetical protein
MACDAVNTTENIKNLGVLWILERKRLRISHVASIQSHGKSKRALDPMRINQHGCQNEIKVLTRETMKGRIYHSNYDTF